MNKRENYLILIVGTLAIMAMSCNRNADNPVANELHPTGPYLGQPLPRSAAEIFAPGIISLGPSTRDVTMTPNGKEIFFCMSVPPYSTILTTRLEKDGWTEPMIMEQFSDPHYYNFEPAVSPDGRRMFFLSNRPDTAKGDTAPDQDIWVMERTEEGWGLPYNLGAPVNTDDEEYYPSVTRDGTLYFTRAVKGNPINNIYRSRFIDGKYTEPELLPKQVNCGTNRYNAYISPDEKFIIIPANGMEETYGGTDYYISFRDDKDNWSEPVNMGPTVNTVSTREYSASLSPDGKYLFFMSQRSLKMPEKMTRDMMKEAYFEAGNSSSAIYWVDAAFINELK